MQVCIGVPMDFKAPLKCETNLNQILMREKKECKLKFTWEYLKDAFKLVIITEGD